MDETAQMYDFSVCKSKLKYTFTVSKIYIYMSTENHDASTPVDLTEEQLDEIVKKKYGKSISELTKAPEKVLTEDEKRELERQENEEAIRYGIEKGIINVSEHEEYIKTLAGDKYEVAKSKFISYFPDLPDAGKYFDDLMLQDEDDELENGENGVTENYHKKIAKQFAAKIAEEELDKKFSKIKNLPKELKAAKEKEALEKKNETVIDQVLSTINNRLETEYLGVKFGIDIDPVDIKEAREMVKKELGSKELVPKEVLENINLFLVTKNLDKLMQEGIGKAVEKAIDLHKRGEKGLLESIAESGSGNISGKRAAMIRLGILPSTSATK